MNTSAKVSNVIEIDRGHGSFVNCYLALKMGILVPLKRWIDSNTKTSGSLSNDVQMVCP